MDEIVKAIDKCQDRVTSWNTIGVTLMLYTMP